MKTQQDLLTSTLPRRVLLVLSVLVTLCIAVDSAFHASHIMVFFSLIVLTILFFSIYIESDKHKLGVAIVCLILGSLYLVFNPIDFSWWRFSLYSATLYFAAILFFASWMLNRHLHHTSHKSGG
jgi:hypothetical protein